MIGFNYTYQVLTVLNSLLSVESQSCELIKNKIIDLPLSKQNQNINADKITD